MKSIKKKVVSNIFKIGESLKPILLKIIPKKYLNKAKTKLLNTVYNSKIDSERIPFIKGEYPFGVNLIGYVKSPFGLGEGCRLYASVLEKTSIPFGIIDIKSGTIFNNKDRKCNKKIIKNPKFNINIFHINPEEMLRLKVTLPENTWDKRYNIGIWLWELPEFPDEWFNAFSLVDEIWAPSQYCVDTIAKKSPVPVKLMPYGLSAVSSRKFDRKHFGLPLGSFLFLIMFDAKANFKRKNPLGAIKAYKRAFRKEDNSVGLIIKISNLTDEITAIIKEELEGYKNIKIIEKTLSKLEVNSLISICDVLVSLHRCESFGLVIAEAMLLKTAVIATCWSGNSDFMTTETACCVDSQLVEIDDDYTIFKANQFWANPDIIQATVFMKILKADSNYRKLITQNAYNFIIKNYSNKIGKDLLYKRIVEINNNIS